MRIGDINQDNVATYLSLFSGMSSNCNIASNNFSSIFSSVQQGMQQPTDYEATKKPLIPGMDIANRPNWRKQVDVSDDVMAKIENLAKSEFINNKGMTDGEELSRIIRSYILTIPEDDRLSASYTLSKAFQEKSQEYVDKVRENNPGWKHGDPFDTSLLDDKKNDGILLDKKV